jgi:hypothetical protein
MTMRSCPTCLDRWGSVHIVTLHALSARQITNLLRLTPFSKGDFACAMPRLAALSTLFGK